MPIPSGFAGNQSGYYSRSDGAGPFSFNGTAMSFAGVGPVTTASSGNQANSSAVASFIGTVGQLAYLTGFEITGTGSTAGGVVTATIDGLFGGVQAQYTVVVPAGVATSLTPLIVNFNPPIQANSTGAVITVTLPALGAGNTNATVVAHGFIV
jgi:hypothetical protein